MTLGSAGDVTSAQRGACDGLLSLEKSRLTDYVGELSDAKKALLDKALQIALALPRHGRGDGGGIRTGCLNKSAVGRVAQHHASQALDHAVVEAEMLIDDDSIA